jgi:hypothetical protein
MQASIETYASSFYMREETDYLAIYQVGESGAIPLLEPVAYHNSVRNAFLERPLEVLSGPTALVDSVMSVLTEMDSLKPHAGLAPAVVVFSDGTDVVSSQYAQEDVYNYAASQGIPVHTVWLNNTNLGDPSRGQDYLRTTATTARGIAASLDTPETLSPIWERIDSFRARTLLRYTVAPDSGGDATVEVALQAEPTVAATLQVNVPANAPSVVIDLPMESRALSLPDLEDPVRLRLGATVDWLDGTQRSILRAQLLVNNLVVADIDPEELGSFTAEIGQFAFGTNTVQIVIEDEQGLQATSPPVSLVITEGETELPEALQPGGAFSSLGRWALLCGGVVILLGLALFLAMNRGRLNVSAWRERLRGRRRRRARTEEVDQDHVAAAGDEDDDGLVAPYLELIESVTRLPPILPIEQVETRLGRSPANADIVFEQDPTVSRLHASIIYSEDEFRIFDEQSTSGTWVNEQPVPGYGARLVTGDEIRIGSVRLIFHWG